MEFIRCLFNDNNCQNWRVLICFLSFWTVGSILNVNSVKLIPNFLKVIYTLFPFTNFEFETVPVSLITAYFYKLGKRTILVICSWQWQAFPDLRFVSKNKDNLLKVRDWYYKQTLPSKVIEVISIFFSFDICHGWRNDSWMPIYKTTNFSQFLCANQSTIVEPHKLLFWGFFLKNPQIFF